MCSSYCVDNGNACRGASDEEAKNAEASRENGDQTTRVLSVMGPAPSSGLQNSTAMMRDKQRADRKAIN